jgi:hypothetical protein
MSKPRPSFIWKHVGDTGQLCTFGRQPGYCRAGGGFYSQFLGTFSHTPQPTSSRVLQAVFSPPPLSGIAFCACISCAKLLCLVCPMLPVILPGGQQLEGYDHALLAPSRPQCGKHVLRLLWWWHCCHPPCGLWDPEAPQTHGEDFHELCEFLCLRWLVDHTKS